MDSDIAACEKKLGKEPPLGTHENMNHQVTLSKNITERLQTGICSIFQLPQMLESCLSSFFIIIPKK